MCREGFGDLLYDPIRQPRPLDEFHDKRERPLRLFSPDSMRDVWMVLRGKDFSFALESGETLGITRHRRLAAP